MRVILTTSTILYVFGCFVWGLIILLPMVCMCLIWLNMHIFSWRLVLIIFLSLRVVITCTLFYFSVSCWLDIAYRTCWNDVGFFSDNYEDPDIIPVSIWKFSILWAVIFWLKDVWHVVMLTVLCDNNNGIYPCCKINIPFKYISFLIKRWSERSIFNGGRVEIFVPSIFSEPGDQPLPNLLLFSSIFQMKIIWVSWCVGTTISLWLYCLCNPLMILLVFCYPGF